MTALDAAAPPLRSAPPSRHDRQPAAPDAPLSLPLPSPAMHHHPSPPSPLHPSPSSTPLPVHVRASDTPKARARLACNNCRRSKVRCGANTGDIVRPCPQCQKGGKTCTWPDEDSNSTTLPAIKSLAPAHQHHDPLPDLQRHVDSRKRKKPLTSALDKLSMSDADLLPMHRIPLTMWDELYDVFKHHFATELPFLHGFSFAKNLKRTDGLKLSPHFDVLRQAFLSLTIPFHKTFERQTSQDPFRVARNYAESAERSINFDTLSTPRLELTQALLMLSLRAHGEGQGSKSFMLLGNAIKTMQLLKCQFDHDLVDRDIDDKKRSFQNQGTRDDSLSDQRFIMEETRRRTFWSCFIVDRYISSGDYKPRSILLEDPLVLVQLPCSEYRFDHGLKTKTRMLGESDEEFRERHKKYLRDVQDYQGRDRNQRRPVDADVKWEDEDAQSPLVWLIKALDIFGDVMRFTCTVTRRADKEYPWNRESANALSFYKLNQKLDDLTDRLPADLRLTPSVRDTHIHYHRAAPYALLHSTLLMCRIALHREYLPYITEPKSFPQGPTDGPNCEELQRACEREDPNFWKDSARTFFKATRDGFDLFVACKRSGALVETPLTAFVCHAVTFNIMWLAFFPNFDQDGVLCAGEGRPDEMVVSNFEDAFGILRHLQERLKLARSFSKRLTKFFYSLMDFKSQYNNPDSPTEMKVSHGLKKYLDMEKDHKEFGDDIVEPDTAFEECPALRALLLIYNSEETPTDSHYSPNAAKSEVKNESASSKELVTNFSSAPTDTRSFTSVNTASLPQQPYRNGYPQPYAPNNVPSFAPAPDLTPQYPSAYARDHSSGNKVPVPVPHNMVDHQDNNYEQVAPTDGIQFPPGLENYSNIVWSQHQPMGYLTVEETQVYTGNVSGMSDLNQFYAHPQSLPPEYYDGTQGP